MQYRKLQADKIFNGINWMEEGSVLILDEDGTLKDVIARENAGEGIELVQGILSPGLINCHCHLELSHLKNVLPTHTGLVDFLLTVIQKRNFAKEEISKAIATAEKEMYESGIVAVADICNTDHAVLIKRESSLYWHNLIEVMNLHEENLEKQLANFHTILQKYKNLESPLSSSTLTPHAPYSLSDAGFRVLNEATANTVISIHNQESRAEDEVFKTGEGAFLKLFTALGEQGSPFALTGKSSLQTWLPHFTNGQTILLVHNTFISEEDIFFAQQHAKKYGLQIVYCICPNANLYIENTLPPLDLLIKHGCKIVLGTDSYSSNWQLNIAAEIKTIADNFPQVSLETLLQWATCNGAEVLGYSGFLGSFEKGKKPGIVLLETDPLAKKNITGKSTRII